MVPTLHTEELVEGRVVIWPPLPDRPKAPPEGTTRIIFTLEPGLEGPMEAIPDRRGMWQERFAILDEREHKLKIEASWNEEISPRYESLKATQVRIPQSEARLVRLELWHPVRLSQREAGQARNIIRSIQEKYPCTLETQGNAAIARCWRKSNDHPSETISQAQSRAGKAILYFKRAYLYDKRNKLLQEQGSLELSVALFCDAAETFGQIGPEEVPSTVDLNLMKVFHSDALLQCAREQSGEDRNTRIREGIHQAEALAFDETLLSERKLYARILGNWLTLLRLLSPDPNEDLVVARTLRSAAPETWIQFRGAASRFYRLEFHDPEESDYIVADRITRITRKLQGR